jgi:hypothetical protein
MAAAAEAAQSLLLSRVECAVTSRTVVLETTSAEGDGQSTSGRGRERREEQDDTVASSAPLNRPLHTRPSRARSMVAKKKALVPDWVAERDWLGVVWRRGRLTEKNLRGCVAAVVERRERETRARVCDVYKSTVFHNRQIGVMRSEEKERDARARARLENKERKAPRPNPLPLTPTPP